MDNFKNINGFDNYNFENYDSYKKIFKESLLKDYFNIINLETKIKVNNKFLKFKEFYFHYIIFEGFIKNNLKIDETYFLQEPINKNTFNKYLNKIIKIYKSQKLPIPEIKQYLKNIIESFVELSTITNYNFGFTINFYSLIKLAEKNPRFKEILNYQIDPSNNIYDSEKKLEEVTKEFIKILKTEDNCLKYFILSEVGIREKQLRESFINIGYKPDLKGNIIDRPINSNFAKGIQNKIDFYNNSIGSRKALIVNFKAVKSSGYFTRKLLLLSLDINLDKTVADCKTKHYLKVKVLNNEHLKMLNGKSYYSKKHNKLKVIDFEKSTKLIGKTILVRSPITCALGNYKICKKCYSNLLSNINEDLHIGIISTLLLTNQFTQNLLSSKHLLRIKTKEIKWDSIIEKFFVIKKDSIKFQEDLNLSIEIENDDIDIDDNNHYKFQKFTILYQKEKIKCEVPVSLELPMKYYEKNEENSNIIINSKEYKGNFKFTVENIEFSKSLKNIIKLLDTNNHLLTKEELKNKKTEVFELIYAKFIELLINSKIDINSTHIEILLKRLIRNKLNPLEPLDFSKENLDDYIILRVTDAIINNPSVAIGLSFERIKKQLNTPNFFTKEGYSLIDNLYE